MGTKQDFFQKKLSNTRSFTRQRKASHIWFLIIIAILLAGILGLIGRKLFFAPVKLDDVVGNPKENDFSLGQVIALKGEIKADGDIVTHTHTINDPEFGIMKIKSDTINLGEYVGIVELTGIVEKKTYQLSPIIKVIQLSGTIANSKGSETDIVLDGNSGVYILGAGIQFLPEFFDKYVLLNEGENGEIQIQDVESGENIVINYFRCNSSDPNRNCNGLNETFANTSAQSFVTSNGDVYYKQNGIQSRFVSNGNRRGMFINDVPDDTIMSLKDVIVFANEKVMKNWLNFSAMKLCQGSGEKLQKIENSEIMLKQEGLIAMISGNGIEKQVSCQILVDFSLPTKGVLQNITVGDIIPVSGEETEENLENSSNEGEEQDIKMDENQSANDITLKRDPNVVQFPIKQEGGLVYPSSRGGYRLQFPSSNISYAVSAVKENFNNENISCSYVINVIKYSEKENLEVSPAIRIYECSANGTINSWAENYVIKYALDKVFVVQINDSSWIEFANNLQFGTLE